MRRFLLILGLNFLAFSTALATEQIADILVIGSDTVYLKTFPLEYLRVKHRIKKTPFEYNGHSFPHTACWRGYVATWHIIDETLVLKEVQKIDSIGTKLNIVEYLESVGFNPIIINGLVFADWYSDTLKSYDYFYNFAFWNNRMSDRLYLNSVLYSDYLRKNDKRIKLIFENGKLIENGIIPTEAYKVGDILSLDVYYFQDWYIWGDYKKVRVKGAIRENNGKKVRLEIFSFGTDKKRIKRKVQKEIKDLDNFWINPRYCEIAE